MKLLLDQGLPRTTVSYLLEAGVDAVHVGDIGFATAEDSEIIEKGRLENRIIVTLDADFHALLALSGAILPSVIRIRIEGLKGDALASLLLQLLVDWQEALTSGAVLTVQKGRVRMRHLPLLP